MDYQARRRAKELHLGDDELIVARRELDDLRDAVYVLACAVEDVDRDLAERPVAGRGAHRRWTGSWTPPARSPNADNPRYVK